MFRFHNSNIGQWGRKVFPKWKTMISLTILKWISEFDKKCHYFPTITFRFRDMEGWPVNIMFKSISSPTLDSMKKYWEIVKRGGKNWMKKFIQFHLENLINFSSHSFYSYFCYSWTDFVVSPALLLSCFLRSFFSNCDDFRFFFDDNESWIFRFKLSSSFFSPVSSSNFSSEIRPEHISHHFQDSVKELKQKKNEW